MNKNVKLLFLLTTVFMLLLTVSAINAADNNDTTVISTDSSTANVVEEVDVPVVNNNKLIDKKTESKVIKKEATTHIVNQDNVDTIFGGDGYGLADTVSEGDTLDFQGTIDKNHSIVINKPVTVVSSTKNAVISLHTVAGSLMGEDPGNSFVVNIGASGSHISGLYLNNTECWIHNVYNATLYNMTMHVENARVGSGVGQTSLRYCNNVVMDSCHIYTENNGGSSSFVWTGCNNCTIVNSTIQAEGQVGNLLYVGNAANTGDKPANYTITNFDNRIINCTVIGGSGGSSNPLQNGGVRTYVEGNKFYSGGSAGAAAWGSSGATIIFVGNEFYRTVAMYVAANSMAYNNVFYGSGSVTITANDTVYNNTINAATISGTPALFENNTVKGKLTVNQPANINNNNLSDVTLGTNAKNTNITNNNITGTVTSPVANVVISDNNITTSNDKTVVVTGASNTIKNNILLTTVQAGSDTISVKDDTIVENNTPEAAGVFEITDETYSNFFDADGVLNNSDVTSYSTIILKDTFNDKSFKFNNVKVKIQGNNAIINNGFIEADDTATILVENMIFNNTKTGIENTILLNTNDNIVRNVSIYRNSNAGISREILVNGDNNLVNNTKFNLEIPVENIVFVNYPFAISNATAITVLGSFNTLANNTIDVVNTTSSYGTISVIDIASQTKSTNNTVVNNTINANSTGYLYGVNLGANTECNNISSNKITLDSGYYSNGVQIGYSPAENNTIYNNTINLTSPVAYGILASAYGGTVSGSNINSNKIYITANQLAAIELCGSTPDLIKDTVINSNTINVDGNYSIAIAVAGSNINMTTNTITVKGTTNATDDSSWDIIKPTTAGIVIQNSNTVNAFNNTMNVTGGANVILNDTNDTKVISTLNTMTRYVNAQTTANFILSNSNNNIIEAQRAYTTGTYSVELTGSSNNTIKNNILNASNLLGGNSAIKMDEASLDNVLENNTPTFGLLTDETYSSLFDENGVYLFPDDVNVLSLAGDLHNKDLIFTNNVTLTNTKNYTIYNGSIILNDIEDQVYTDRFVNIFNININNTNKAALIDNLTTTKQRNIQYFGGSMTVNGDDIVVIESVKTPKTYAIVDVENATITADGSNVVVAKMTRDTYNTNDYLKIKGCNITSTATGANTIAEIYNVNVDILNNIINATGANVTVMDADNVYGAGQFFMNNKINASGDNLELVVLTDNQGSNPSFGNNTIYASSTNPVVAMNISNSGDVYVGQGAYSYASYNTPNIIVIDADNGEVPVIIVDDNGYVRNNYVYANDVYGEEAVSAKTVSNITPDDTRVEITTTEASYNKPLTITAKAVNNTGKAVSGTYVLTINGEEVSRVNSNSITYNYTPTSLDDVIVKVDFINTTINHFPSSENVTLSIAKGEVTITMEDIEAQAGETVTLNATVRDASNNLVTTGKLAFKVNGKTVKDENGKIIYVKLVDGVASVNYTIPDEFEGRNIVVTAVYGGSANFMTAKNTSTLTVLETDDELEFVDTPTTAAKGESIKLSVKVGDLTGKVAFKLNGKTLKGADGKIIYATITDGVASIDYVIPETYKAKDYTLTAVLITSNAQRLEVNQTLTITE